MRRLVVSDMSQMNEVKAFIEIRYRCVSCVNLRITGKQHVANGRAIQVMDTNSRNSQP